MHAIPAIDLLNGQCVRLQKGDFASSKVYDEDPCALAHSFAAAGVRRLHLVDLDGAKHGSSENLDILRGMRSSGLRIDFGGGVSSKEICRAALEAGAAQVTVGSVAVLQPREFESWVELYGAERFIAALDVHEGEVRVTGWQKGSGRKLREVLPELLAIGVRDVLCTEISRDGMLTGPALDLYEQILGSDPAIRLWASGGVRSLEDLNQLRECGCACAVVGRALYEGRVKVDELVDFNSAATE